MFFTYVYVTYITTLFSIKKFSSDQFGLYLFCQNILIFWYCYMITNFKIRICIFFWTSQLIYALDLINRFLFIVFDTYYCNYQMYYLIYQHNRFWYCSHLFLSFVLQSSITFTTFLYLPYFVLFMTRPKWFECISNYINFLVLFLFFVLILSFLVSIWVALLYQKNMYILETIHVFTPYMFYKAIPY